jgi:hypothetical protein
MAKKSMTARKNNEGRQRRADDLFTWRVLGVMAFLAAWTFFFYRFEWPSAIYALPAGLAVIYLLAYIYPRDFIALAVLICGGILGLWVLTVLYQHGGRRVTLAHIAFGAAVAVAALLVWYMWEKQGVIGFGKLKLPVMPRKGRYVFLFTACIILALALAAAIVFGRPGAIISVVALLCYLFVAAVYYTVKLI